MKKWLLPAGVILVVSVFVAWKSLAPVPIRKAENFNIVYLSIDTTRADFFGCYGNTNIATPNLDRLAREGVLFENFYSTINTTLAAHSSMFTGLYPRNHGVGRNSMRLNQKNLTMAEFLHAQGYTTSAFIGSFALSSVFGFQQGFETFEESFIGDLSDYHARNVTFENRDQKAFEMVLTKTKVGHIERRAEDVNRAFFQWLDQNKNKKFFAFLHYYDPHFPYHPPEKWFKKWMDRIPEGTPLATAERPEFEKIFEKMDATLATFTPQNIGELELPENMSALLKLYAAEIEYVDHAVGQIIERLERDNLRKKTIFVITADHGENLVDHPEFKTFFRHGFLTHDSETQIPFLISAPGLLPQGRRVDQPASQIDVFPTMMQLLGFDAPAADGTSLALDLFRDRKPLKRTIFSEASQPHVNFRRKAAEMVWVNDQNSAFARDANFKYIHAPWISFEGVYDPKEDPRETRNLLGSADSKIVKELREEMKKWRSKAQLGNVDAAFELSEEDREKLKSLGYVQ